MSKMKGIPVILGVLLLVASTGVALAPGGQQSAESLYEAAVFKKDAGGDMEGAIKIFREVIDRFPKNLEIAAKAQLQIGLCYEKLGFQEAEEAFQKVVDNYPNQTEAVKLAREKLSLLQRAKAIVEEEVQGIKLTEIPIDPEKNYYSFAFISPDGKKVASVDLPGDIWITDIASGKEMQLTKTPAFEFWCFWSPDSQKIVYLDGTRNLYFASAQGESNTQIEIKPGFDKEGWFSSWSPDSQKLNLWFSKHGLYAVPISGGEWEEIFGYSSPDQAKTHANLILSPNGKYLAYNDTTGNMDIYIRPAEGGKPVQITNYPGKDAIQPIGQIWSYDGRWLVFFSDRNGSSEPWIIGISPDGKRQGEPFQIPFLPTAKVTTASWTKENQIGISIGKAVSNLFVSSLDGEEEMQLTYVEKNEMGAVWSPDNKYIAYISSDFGTNREVWIVPVQGGEPQKISGQLTTRPGVWGIYSIAWHPDGRNVSCVTYGEDYSPWLIDIQSGAASKIPFDYDGHMRGMDWSPDGNRFAFNYTGEEGAQNSIEDSDVEYSNIYTMSADGGEPLRVTHAKEEGLGFRSPSWSPDGRRIACVCDNNRIWVVSSEGGEPRAITENKGRIKGMSWSPDGNDILFARYEGAKDDTAIYYSVSSQGGEPRKIDIKGSWDLDLSPDGKKIVYCRQLKMINQFWVLENFLPEKK